MDCPFCSTPDTGVTDSRPNEENAIRRRRQCPGCGGRFTTYERIAIRDLVVIKRSGRRVPFDRDKLARSIGLAAANRPIEPGRLNSEVANIVRRLEAMGENEIDSLTIGDAVMDALRALDDVAFVRYASVYKVFMQASDFIRFLEQEALA